MDREARGPRQGFLFYRRYAYGRREDIRRQRARVDRSVEPGRGGITRLLLEAVRLEDRRPGSGGRELRAREGRRQGRCGHRSLAGPQAPTAWMVYIGTRDAAATAKQVEQAG